jgi:hypothetical protein
MDLTVQIRRSGPAPEPGGAAKLGLQPPFWRLLPLCPLVHPFRGASQRLVLGRHLPLAKASPYRRNWRSRSSVWPGKGILRRAGRWPVLARRGVESELAARYSFKATYRRFMSEADPERKGEKRVHMSERRSLAGASLAAETSGSPGEESRLKAGCSQDWLPHKRPIDNRPQVNNLPHKARGFLESVNAARMSACATIWSVNSRRVSPRRR